MGGKKEKDEIFHFISHHQLKKTHATTRVPPTNNLWLRWCSTILTDEQTNKYLCHWHWAVFVLGILRVVHRSIKSHLFFFFLSLTSCGALGFSSSPPVCECVSEIKKVFCKTRTKRRKIICMHAWFFFFFWSRVLPSLFFNSQRGKKTSSFKTTPFSSLKTEEEEGTYTNTNKDDDGR